MPSQYDYTDILFCLYYYLNLYSYLKENFCIPQCAIRKTRRDIDRCQKLSDCWFYENLSERLNTCTWMMLYFLSGTCKSWTLNSYRVSSICNLHYICKYVNFHNILCNYEKFKHENQATVFFILNIYQRNTNFLLVVSVKYIF